MKNLFGGMRTVVRPRYALIAGGDSRSTGLPGWEKAACQVLVSPRLGARFSQTLITLERDGQCVGNTANNQYFIYFLEGNGSIEIDERRHRLEPGSYVYLPPGKDIQFRSGGPSTRILVFQKPYAALPGFPTPAAFVRHERESKSTPVESLEEVRAQPLLPERPEYDLEIDLVSWHPGVGLPIVQAQFPEQGWFMLGGQGLICLASDWYPVQAGDAVWIGSHCPQWFVAVGKAPATFLVYREHHRDPM
jgi:(S)-ureidoglycine aminohydrolase